MKKGLLILGLLLSATVLLRAEPDVFQWNAQQWFSSDYDQRRCIATGIIMGTMGSLLWLEAQGETLLGEAFPIWEELNTDQVEEDISLWYLDTMELDWPVIAVFFEVQRLKAEEKEYDPWAKIPNPLRNN